MPKTTSALKPHKTESSSDKARSSTIKAGGDIALAATGAGQASNLLIQGSDIQASKTATLTADNQVTLQAAQNTSEQHGSNSGSSGAIGVSLMFGGAQSGLSIQASASKAKGNSNGQDETWSNTHVSGNQVNLESGGDTTLKGAVVSGQQVTADAGACPPDFVGQFA